MSKLPINTGTGPDSNDGEEMRSAFWKVDVNFEEVFNYASGIDAEHQVVSGQALSVSGDVTALRNDFEGALGSFSGYFGWQNWVDGTYVSGSPYSLAGDTTVVIPNDGSGALTFTGNSPSAYPDIYDRNKRRILGFSGSNFDIVLETQVVPTSPSTTYIEFWVDIGGGIDPLYRRIVTFPRGTNEVRPITISTAMYMLDTWEANSGQYKMRANGPCDVYDSRFVFHAKGPRLS